LQLFFCLSQQSTDQQPIIAAPRRIAYALLRHVSRGELAQPRVVVFVCGLPGAGKSTLIERRYGRCNHRTVVLDLDHELTQHPRFNPADPEALYHGRLGRAAYKWADERVEARYREALSEHGLRRVVIDGTGTNAARRVRRMLMARHAGWFVKVLYVHIPLETAIRRAATRARPVSARKIYSYQEKIAEAMVAVSDYADEFEHFDAPAPDDPAHVLAREGYVNKLRALNAAEEARRQRALLAQARSRSALALSGAKSNK